MQNIPYISITSLHAMKLHHFLTAMHMFATFGSPLMYLKTIEAKAA